MSKQAQANVSALNFLTPDDVQKWLDAGADQWVADLEIGSMSLLEHLTGAITGPDDPHFNTYYEQTIAFLARLDDALKASDGPLQDKLASIFGILMYFLAEAGPYRFETKASPDNSAMLDLLTQYREVRLRVVEVGVTFFQQSVFDPIRDAIEQEVIPILKSACEIFDGQDNQYFPFRVLLAANLAEQLRLISHRLDPQAHSTLAELLNDIYRLKYVRFGTSGYRGVWNRDFTEEKVRVVAQAICDFLKLQNMPPYASKGGEDLSGRVIVIGYDGRRTSPTVGRWVAEVCLANGFDVYFASRPTPTPALNYFAREFIGRDRVAGLINCTASHNPPEWQGIKFNPKEGYPAPSSLTNLIGYHCNIRQLLNIESPAADTVAAEIEGRFQQFDPKDLFLNWLRESGQPGADNNRLSINLEAIKEYFADKLIVLDPMYGSGRGYLSTLLGELGVPHISLHDERDEDLGRQTEVVRGIPRLEYANPEPGFIDPLVETVKERGAALGVGLDTDADRFGAVDQGGVYIRPNQILAMLIRYFGLDRGETGRVIITQTGLPMIDAIAGKIKGNEVHKPPEGTIPAYIAHPFYHRRVGAGADANFPNTYVVPVGIKYIVDVARVIDGETDPTKAYDAQSDADLPAPWMERMLIGGEESSGLTTRGHVPDKDGIWANLLIMDLLAYYGLKSDSGETSLVEIWNQTTADMDWPTYGDRADIDADSEAKTSLLNYYLDVYKDWQPDDVFPELCGLEIYYCGGTRYDMVEIFLQEAKYGRKHFLRVRASGTEPILRIYVESAEPAFADELLDMVLDRLDSINAEVIKQAYDLERLADLLSNTRFADSAFNATKQLLDEKGWDMIILCELLEKRRVYVESRNIKLINHWVAALS